jgi:MFS family permease
VSPSDPQSPVRPPSSRWPFRWIAVALAVTAFGAGAPSPLYPIFQVRYAISSAVLAAIFGAYVIGVLITMFLLAPQSDLLGRKPVLYVGMLLTALSGVAFLLASSVAGLFLARIISGLAVGATTATATASMAGLEPRADQHHVARVSVAANFGGVATGILLSGFLVGEVARGSEWIFVVLILASGAGLLLIASTPETATLAAPGQPFRLLRIRVPASIRRPFWVAAGALAACYSIYGLFAALAPSFLRDHLGVESPWLGAAIVSLLFGLVAIAQLALGQVRDRRAMLIGLPVLFAALLVVTAAIVADSLGLLVGAIALLGIGIAFAYMGSVTLVDRVAPGAHRAETLAAYFIIGYLSLAVPTIGVGAGADAIGLPSAALIFGVGLAVFVGALALLTQRTPTPPGGEGRAR